MLRRFGAWYFRKVLYVQIKLPAAMNLKRVNRKNRHLHSDVKFCRERVFELCELGDETSVDELRFDLDRQREREVGGHKSVDKELNKCLQNTGK